MFRCSGMSPLQIVFHLHLPRCSSPRAADLEPRQPHNVKPLPYRCLCNKRHLATHNNHLLLLTTDHPKESTLLREITMSFQQRPREANSEATEPLYRDSSDHTEKSSQHDLNAQTQALQASVRRLRRWLIAVSVLLGLVSAYTLFSFRHVVRDHKSSKRLEFAPESTST